MVSEDGTAGRTGTKPNRLAGIVVLVLVMVIVTSFVLYSASTVEWKTIRIDRTDGPVYWPYVATGEDGALHMTYYVNGSLIHSALMDEGWEHSTVAEAPIWGTSPIVFDSDGTPHICYQVQDEAPSSSNCILKHAEMVDGEWHKSVVSDTSTKGSHSMALDAAGNAHVAFIQSGGFVYANDTAGEWQETYLLEQAIASDVYGMTSIAVDASGHPYVAVGHNRGFVGVFSEVGDSWNLTNLFYWDKTFNPVSVAVGDDGTVVVSYWGYPAGEPESRGLMLASKGSGGWITEAVYTPQSDPDEFRCSVSAAEGGVVKIAADLRDDGECSLVVVTSSDGSWDHSEVIGPYDNSGYSTWQSHLSICSGEDGQSIVSINRGAAEYATDSLDLSDRLSAVSFIALVGYSVGLVIWIIVLRYSRVLQDKSRGRAKD